MRELDQLLVDYLEHRYPAATAADKRAFEALLELSDPELVGYLLHKEEPAPDHASVIRDILDRSST